MSHNTSQQVGVIGVGTMGRHHARVYNELNSAELIGVADADPEQAADIASEYSTATYDIGALIERAEAVTIAVPTAYHHDIATQCIEAGTDLLVEKPFVDDPERGYDLIDQAAAADVTLQVGHIERFNPVIDALADIIPGLDVISVAAERLGPQPDRTIEDSAVTDLMIHDLDVLCSLLDEPVSAVSASGAADGRHATATLEFADGVLGRLTASRVTQQKIRELTITAEECFVTVDYLEQSVQIHRQSIPEYVASNGDVTYRHESIIENPAVENGEPLKHELRSFLEASRNGTAPRVTGEDGIRALELAQEINHSAFGTEHKRVGVVQE